MKVRPVRLQYELETLVEQPELFVEEVRSFFRLVR
jgi:hypothetical protein